MDTFSVRSATYMHRIVCLALLATALSSAGPAAAHAAIGYSVARVTPVPVQPGEALEWDVTVTSDTVGPGGSFTTGAGETLALHVVSEAGDPGGHISCVDDPPGPPDVQDISMPCAISAGFVGSATIRVRSTTPVRYQATRITVAQGGSVVAESSSFEIARGGPSALVVEPAPGFPTPAQLASATTPIPAAVRISNLGAGTAHASLSMRLDIYPGDWPSCTYEDLSPGSWKRCALDPIPPGAHLDFPIVLPAQSAGFGAIGVSKLDGGPDVADTWLEDGIATRHPLDDIEEASTGAELILWWKFVAPPAGPDPTPPTPLPPTPVVPIKVDPVAPAPPTLGPSFVSPISKPAIAAGFSVPIRCTQGCTATARVTVPPAVKRRLKLRSATLATATVRSPGAGDLSVRVRPAAIVRRVLSAARGRIPLTITIEVVAGGATTRIVRTSVLR